MRVIGLTGGIASGKSLVSEQLAALGATVLDADKLGHETYLPGTSAHGEIVEAFGRDVLAADGEIDRRALGAKVFGDASGESRKRLEAIVWPAIRRLAAERIEQMREEGVSVIVLEAAVLIEAEWLDIVDEVWLVVVEPAIARQRVVERNGLTEEQADSRIAAQLTNDERRPYAQVVIENNGTLEDLRRAVNDAWANLTAKVG
jgi:phosphopantetheine adenylyltransferase/dephospho-CoA kinase